MRSNRISYQQIAFGRLRCFVAKTLLAMTTSNYAPLVNTSRLTKRLGWPARNVPANPICYQKSTTAASSTVSMVMFATPIAARPVGVLRRLHDALDPRLHQVVIERCCNQRPTGCPPSTAAAPACTDRHALGRIELNIGLRDQLVKLFVLVALALREGRIALPVHAQPVLRIRIVRAPALAGQQREGLGILGDAP